MSEQPHDVRKSLSQRRRPLSGCDWYWVAVTSVCRGGDGRVCLRRALWWPHYVEVHDCDKAGELSPTNCMVPSTNIPGTMCLPVIEIYSIQDECIAYSIRVRCTASQEEATINFSWSRLNWRCVRAGSS